MTNYRRYLYGAHGKTIEMKKNIREIVLPLIAIIAAFIAGGIIVFAVGDNPFEVYDLLISSAVSWPDGIGYTLFYATPLIFTGLAVAVAFKCGLLNIGAEGQLTVGAFAAAWAGITLAGLPAWLLVPTACLAAILAGALWGAVPGMLKARFGSHEVINTIMMNFIAAGVVAYLTQYHYKLPGDAILQTAPIGEGAHIPRLHSLLVPLGINFPERLPLNVGFILALLACAVIYLLLWKTRWGYEIRAVGSNSSAAEYGGINVPRRVVLAMAISGALAGMVGINEVLGHRFRYYDGFSAGYGFTGIAVALLGRNHPIGVLLAGILFGALTRGGLFVDIFTDNVSKDLVAVLQGIIILFVACEALFDPTPYIRRFMSGRNPVGAPGRGQ